MGLQLKPSTRKKGYITVDGSNDYGQCNTNVGLFPGQFVIDFQFYFSNLSGYQAIIAKIKTDSTVNVPAGWQLKKNNTNKCFLEWSTNGNTSETLMGTTVMTTGVMYRSRLIFDGTTITWLLSTDGGTTWTTEITTTSATAIAEFQKDTGYPVYIARSRYGTTFCDYLYGRIGPIRIIKGSSDPTAEATIEYCMYVTGSNPTIPDRLGNYPITTYGGATGTQVANDIFNTSGESIFGPYLLDGIDDYLDSEVLITSIIAESTSIIVSTAITDTISPPESYNNILTISSTGTVGADIYGISQNADLTGKYLWIKVVMQTSNTANTPQITSLGYWLINQDYTDKIQINLTDSGRIKYPIGDVILNFTGSLQGPQNAMVMPFSESFTPVNINKVFNPIDFEYVEVSGQATAALHEITYQSAQEGIEYVELVGATVTAIRYYIDDIPP